MDLISRLNTEATLLRARFEVLSRQSSNGLKGTSLSDLGTDLPRTVDLQNSIKRNETYSRTMDQAGARMSVMQTALSRLSAIATEFRAEISTALSSSNTNSLVTVQSRAKAALKEVGQLLNTQLNGEYLFGGSDLANPPIPDPDGLPTSTMANTIATAVTGLTNANATAVNAATLAAAQDTSAGNSVFSAFLEDPAQGAGEARRSVPVSDGERMTYGIKANANGSANSTGDTTGSWARDLLRGLMTLSSLTDTQMQQGQGFDAVADSLRNIFKSAESALAEETGSLGAVQKQVEAAKTRQSDINTQLTGQLSGLTEVDMATTLTRLQATQTQLEASYRITASLANLTLTKFL
ncbi:hypothetical protein EOD42_15790 [Rhodovarius crocodyli]|uniref:Flagellin n=1 Tax=Rhodovarius crocodyli TaxID=1979269 RepID=A0A437MDI3_9PROT|nr:flagellin [Rhodovarius crocodyli]RVT95660.1 hypothetical protein EOD42_15790 [Rhodovarius crocodyli]